MTDIYTKVIQGLESCVPGPTTWCQMQVKGQCGYDGSYCMSQLHKDAAALLKANAARVMTLEELDAAPSGYVVLQTHDMPDMLEWYDGLLFSVNVNWTVDIITLEGKKRLRKDDYSIKWRCWTARPTDLQREETPWK